MAFAIVDVTGTVNGTTNTVERSEDDASEAVLLVCCAVGVRTSIAWPVPAATSSKIRPLLSVWDSVEGIWMLCVASTTEYRRSHRRKIISRVGPLVTPASKTKVERIASRVISFWNFVEGPTLAPGARAESDVSMIGSEIIVRFVASSTSSSWKECHDPARAELGVNSVAKYVRYSSEDPLRMLR